MNQTMNKRNLSISGAGKATGGVYESVQISGVGKIDGDIESVTSVELSGAAKINGKVRAQSIRMSGACKVTGSVEAQELKASGDCSIGGDVTTEEFSASGACKVAGSVRAQEFESSGMQKIETSLHAQHVKCIGVLKVGGHVEADEFHATGAFEIEGLLSGDQIEIKLCGRSRAREIGGAHIDVRKHKSLSLWIWLARLWEGGPGLITDIIEADEIHLEATRAKIVRGKRTTIGPECYIERIEYSEYLNIDSSSTVKEQVRV